MVGVGGDEGLFSFTGDNLDVDVVTTGEEEALTDREVSEAFLFFVGEFEDVRENIDGGGRLFQEELHRGVGNDGATHFGAHEIFDVLSDGGESEIVFTRAFGEGEEEVCGIFELHELPGLINDKKAAFLFGANDIPNVGEDDIHGDGAKFVFEVADVEDDHLVVDVDVGLLGEDASEGASGVFAEALCEGGAGAFHMEEGVVEVEDGGWGGLMS